MKSFHYLYTQIINLKDMQDVNRLKIVLVEQKKTSKWLSEQLGVNPSTVSFTPTAWKAGETYTVSFALDFP